MDHEKNWQYCKIVEQSKTGELILNQNNLKTLIDAWSKVRNGDDPITLVSFIGPRSCGKSFFTNLFIEYIRMHGSLSWTKRIKREGLQGFSYGVEPVVITVGQLIPEKDINAVYFYPELMKMNVDQREVVICILHVHRGDRTSRNKEVDIALETLLAMMSSAVVNIMWNEKNTLCDINQPTYFPVKDRRLTGNTIQLLRGAGMHESKNVIHLEESSSLHDEKGLVKLSYQQYSAVNNLMKTISTSQNDKSTRPSLSSILERFEENIKMVNACNGFNKPLISYSPKTIGRNTLKRETKSVDEYKPENKKLPEGPNECEQKTAQMPKEMEDKIKNFFANQFSEQLKPEIEHCINNVLLNQNFEPPQNDFDSNLQHFNEQNITRLFREAKKEFQENQKWINDEVMTCIQNFHMMMKTQFEDVPHFGGNALRRALNNTLASVVSDLKFPESKEYIRKATRSMFKIYFQQDSYHQVEKLQDARSEIFDDVANKPDDDFLVSKIGKIRSDSNQMLYNTFGGGSKSGAPKERISLSPFERKLSRIPPDSRKIEISQDMGAIFKDRSLIHEPMPKTYLSDAMIRRLRNTHCRQEPEPATRNIKEELPQATLFYQIALSKVGIATFSRNLWESGSAPSSVTSHPDEIGILMDGKWVCGDDVKTFNQRGMVQRFWSFETIFKTHGLNDTVRINGEKIHITAPFLLGAFFGITKQKEENEQSEKFSSAMISVPFWFSSYRRTQIVEAGTIAGFSHIQLVNENTASAYFGYTSGLCPVNQAMIVISENSNRVDLSIYSYDEQSKVIYMRGQAGDYETARLSKHDVLLHQFVAGTLRYLLNNQKERGIQEKALESLYKVWRLAWSRVQNPLPVDNKSILICCESDHWREFLWKFAAKITSPENISVRNDSPLLGLASMFHTAVVARKIGLVQSLFRDALPFDLTLSPVKGFLSEQKLNIDFSNYDELYTSSDEEEGLLHQTLVLMKKNSTFLELGVQKCCFKLPRFANVSYLNLSERDSTPQIFGKIHLKSKPPPSFNMRVTLQRDRNGIFILNGVDYNEGGRGGGTYDWGAPRKPVPVHYFEWLPCRTSDDTLATYGSVIDQINIQTKSSKKFNDMLKQTEVKAEKIKVAILSCADKFKSSLGKNMVVRQIDDVTEALKQPEIQGKLLNKHVSYLDSVVQKYDLQI